MDSHTISSLIWLIAEASFMWWFVTKVHR